MRFFVPKQYRGIPIFCACLLLCSLTLAFGQSSAGSRLGVMQTAETIGKGGYMTTLGLFQYERQPIAPEQTQGVVLGNFERFHLVEFEMETFLVPIRFTYGIGEHLDLIVGSTFTTSSARKVLPDFYRFRDESEDEELDLDSRKDRRVFDQSLFDLVVGLKHNLTPDVSSKLPSISVGGEMQLGFTADNKLNAAGEFIDRTPANGFPFVGVNTYFVGSYELQDIFRVHGALGMYLSSKSLKSTDSFSLNWQVGGELSVSNELWIVGDFTRKHPILGLTLENLISLGLRYEITDTAAFHLGYVTEPGFQFHLTVGGNRGGPASDDMLF